MLKHRFIARLSSVKEAANINNSLGKSPSFNSYVSTDSLNSFSDDDVIDENIQNFEFESQEPQIFEKPEIIFTPVNTTNNAKLVKANNKTEFRNWRNQRQNAQNLGKIQDPQNANTDEKVSEMLTELQKGNNLAKFLESHGLSPSAISIPQLKEALDQFLSKQSTKKKEISKWEEQLNDLRELTDDSKLEKWLESVGVQPSQVSIPLVKQEIKRYFKEPEKLYSIPAPIIEEPLWGKPLTKDGSSKSKSETSLDKESTTSSDLKTYSESELVIPEFKSLKKNRFGRAEPLENYKGRSLIYQENTLAKKIWDDFKEMSPAKQVAVVVGITVVTAAVGFVSWRILLMMFPRVMSMNHYWAEVLSQWFIQRNDTAFQLLIQHSENAKPLSTAWANQYILWKYI